MYSTLFSIFGLPIRAYGLMLVIGFGLGLARMARVARSRGIEPDRVYDLGLVCLLSGVIGARAVYILINPETEKWSEFIQVWNGGLSFHGGVILALICGWLYTKRAKIPFMVAADLAAPSIAIGYAITRIGCFMNGCCYGAPTSLPWGVSFQEHGLSTPPSHPTQLYAAAASFLIFLLLTRLEKQHRATGFVFVSYLGLYSIYRFLIEFLRAGYSAKVMALGLTEAQVASVVVIVICAVILATVYRRQTSEKCQKR